MHLKMVTFKSHHTTQIFAINRSAEYNNTQTEPTFKVNLKTKYRKIIERINE